MAGLVAHLLVEAGVAEGDRVAVGASGSFPALMVATLAAVQALGAESVTILSLGASSFGATRTDLHLLDIYRVMEREGLVGTPPLALSLGGDGDEGGEFDPTFKESLLQEVRASGIPVLLSSGLEANVTERMARYGVVPEGGQERGSAPGNEEEGRVAAFVNIGGAEANMGTSPMILDVPPGLWKETRSLPLPPQEQRGVLFQMAAAGVPVIHLLHIRGLALRYGLSWDPIPLPQPGSTLIMDGQKGKGMGFWVLTTVFFLTLVLIGLAGHGASSDR
jgi:poly-gamma-glutamate system protein